VLSRGFIRRALELPPGGLEPEIEWLYHRSGRLDKVVNATQTLIQKSKSTGVADMVPPDSEDDRELAVPRLSAGGIITLDRTLTRLIGLRARS
jgi:ubiquitin-conjugating enzyme E2 O